MKYFIFWNGRLVPPEKQSRSRIGVRPQEKQSGMQQKKDAAPAKCENFTNKLMDIPDAAEEEQFQFQ